MALNATITCLNERRSVPRSQLAEPGPDRATLLRILEAAVRVPDHGKREPWRFLRIAGEARNALGEALAARTLERDPGASDAWSSQWSRNWVRTRRSPSPNACRLRPASALQCCRPRRGSASVRSG